MKNEIKFLTVSGWIDKTVIEMINLRKVNKTTPLPLI